MQDPARAVAPVVFSTAALAARDRFDGWRAVFGSLNEVEAPREERADFLAESEIWRLGPMVVGRTRMPARRIVRSAAHCARDGIDHWAIRATRAGAAIMRVGDEVETVGPGDVHVASLADPYVEDRTAGEWVGLFLPRGVHPEIDARLDARGPGVARGATAALLASFAVSLVEGLPRARPSDLPALADAARGMIAACLAGGAAARRADRARLERMRVERAIRAHLSSPTLDAERLCALAGVARSTLYRLFDDGGGVAAHVRKLRLDLARLDLSDPAAAHAPIAEIAARRGFGGASAFCRAYRAAFGETPGETRAAASHGRRLAGARAATGGPTRRPHDGAAGGLAALLR